MLTTLRSRRDHAPAKHPCPLHRMDHGVRQRHAAVVTAMALALGAVIVPSGVGAQPVMEHHRHGYAGDATGPLVEKVRAATGRFTDINVPLGEGWVRGTPCVSGPNGGAMGVHVILPARVADGALDASAPEALIYEPLSSGALRLVGVEFIVLASDWARLHPEGGTPAVDGHLTNYVGEPNRYGLPAFYELHVWAWEHNPSGTFADWNSQVSCDRQPAQ